MTSRLTPISPADLKARLDRHDAILVDIREPDEYARRHVPGALSRPLSGLEGARLKLEPGHDVVFTCKSGMRTGANCDRLADAIEGEAFLLAGGVDAWAAAGLPVKDDASQPLEIMRQVQITAGSLVVLGVVLGVAVHPGFLGLSAFVGAGLAFAGATGFCGMARLLMLAPWNRRAA